MSNVYYASFQNKNKSIKNWYSKVDWPGTEDGFFEWQLLCQLEALDFRSKNRRANIEIKSTPMTLKETIEYACKNRWWLVDYNYYVSLARFESENYQDLGLSSAPSIMKYKEWVTNELIKADEETSKSKDELLSTL